MRLLKALYSRNFKKKSAKFYSYDDIKLKLYLQIASTGNFLLLVIEGEEDIYNCLEHWEEIVKQNAKENGNFEYDTYYYGLKMYSSLMAEYVLVKALLTYLCFSIDYTYIEQVRKLGYKIDTTNTEKYTESITAGLRRADNIKTKIESKAKEIQQLFGSEGEGKAENFEQVLAHLNAALGFNVNEDITLARFNEYKKILKARQSKTVNPYGGD